VATVRIFQPAITVDNPPRVSATFNYLGRTRTVMLAVVSTTWAVDDPSITLHVQPQASFDNGVTWEDFGGFTAHPQSFSSRTGGLPAFNVTANDDLGARLVRCLLYVDPGQTLIVGLDATT
jgi:hypothetical protein